MTRQGTHHGSQDSGHQDTGDPGVKEHLREHDKDAFGVLHHERGLIDVFGKVSATEEAHANGTAQAEHHPKRGGTASAGDDADRLRGHEANEDMGLTAVTQAPSHQGRHADERLVLREHEHRRIDRIDLFDRGTPTAQVIHHGKRRHDQGHAHHGSLDRIGPAHGQETTHEDIRDRGGSTQPKGGGVIEIERVFEQSGTGHHAASRINRKEDQDDDGAANAQKALFVFKAMREVVGQGQGVAALHRVDAQTGSHELPVHIRTDQKPDGQPTFRNTRQENGTR